VTPLAPDPIEAGVPSPSIRHARLTRHALLTRRRGAAFGLPLALAACEVAGLAAVVNSYRIALTTTSDEAEFAWFWLGMIVLELPIVAVIARKATRDAVRVASLILFGMITFAPKLLRDPVSPAFHDEYAHWRETFEILATGKLFNKAPIVPIISQYPGLHAATAAAVNVTGLTIWQAAGVLLLIFHLTLVLGIAALARSLGLSSRAAALIAVLYSFNSSFLYFDTQFAYESMAITLVVWTLVAFVSAIRSRPGNGTTAWCAVTVMLCAGTVVTHHLSSINLALIMTLVSIVLSVPRLARRDGWIRTAVVAWSLTVFMIAAAAAWFAFVAPGTLSYLSPYLGTGLSQLMQVAMGPATGRQLFAASLSPWWEHQAAYLVTAIALCLALAGLIGSRARIRTGMLPRGPRRAALAAFMLLGLAYFPSTLFIFSQAGAEGARRSWAVTWIGLSMAAGPAALWLTDWANRRSRPLSRLGLRAGLLTAAAVALVGGTAAGLNSSYRFPGPFLFGSDARSATPELAAVSQWFLHRFGPGNNIVTDRYTGLAFASSGLQYTANPSAGFPVWDLYIDKPGQPIGPTFLLAELGSSHYDYLVVDARMARGVPQIGIYFAPSEPASFIQPGDKSAFSGRLDKFNSAPWLVKVFQSDSYSIYRINLPPAQAGYQTHRARFRGRLAVGQ
jgi:hypothetical protein